MRRLTFGWRSRLVLLGVGASLTLMLGATAFAAVIQSGNLRVTVLAQVEPPKLPRSTPAPIAVFVSGHIATADGAVPPQLQSMTVKVNRHGLLQSKGLPFCTLPQIQPGSTQRALDDCSEALVGSGRFWATVVFPDQRPYPTRGRLLVFNGRQTTCSDSRSSEPLALPTEAAPVLATKSRFAGTEVSSDTRTRPAAPGSEAEEAAAYAEGASLHPARSRNFVFRGLGGGPTSLTKYRTPNHSVPASVQGSRRDAKCHSRPVLFAHIFTTQPFNSSFVVTFALKRISQGPYGTELSASLPQALGDWGFVDRIKLTLKRKYRYLGKELSYFNAACPAPPGTDTASFPLASAEFSFAAGEQIRVTVPKACRVVE